MNRASASHFEELGLLFPVEVITSSREWMILLARGSIVSDDDLINCISALPQLLEQGLASESKARALLGLMYITGRIAEAIERIRTIGANNLMETDLAISLELPGESSRGLAFLKSDASVGRAASEENVAILTANINDFLVDYPFRLSNGKDHSLALPLLALSQAYSCLAELLLKDF